jgi:intracellular sulfur oxidation DsrE/DsrF family protein
MKKTVATAMLAIALSAGAAWAEGITHYLAIHVDENDPQLMNMALNNAENVASYYEEIGDDVVIEIVAYGPGLNMFIADSPVAARISAMSLEQEDISFAACGNTLDAMAERLGHTPELLSDAVVVPSGVVRLMELQEQGFAYIRP